MKNILLILMAALMLTACHTQKKTAESKPKSAESETTISEDGSPVPNATASKAASLAMASPKVIIYKMKKDYSHHVPVILSEDKKSLVSYPDPKDVYYNGRLAYPTPLNDGYWLDNRGIGPNVAFLSYTYEEYSNFTDVPDINTLYKKIIDKDPIKEMWAGGQRFSYGGDIINELNDLIYNHHLQEKFERVK